MEKSKLLDKKEQSKREKAMEEEMKQIEAKEVLKKEERKRKALLEAEKRKVQEAFEKRKREAEQQKLKEEEEWRQKLRERREREAKEEEEKEREKEAKREKKRQEKEKKRKIEEAEESKKRQAKEAEDKKKREAEEKEKAKREAAEAAKAQAESARLQAEIMRQLPGHGLMGMAQAAQAAAWQQQALPFMAAQAAQVAQVQAAQGAFGCQGCQGCDGFGCNGCNGCMGRFLWRAKWCWCLWRHALSMAAVSCAFCFVQALTPNSKGILTFVSCLFGVPAHRRLDGVWNHDYGLVENFRRCRVSTDLKTAGLWTEGSLQSCVNLVTGAANRQGLCSGLYINYAAGKGCECAQDHCDDRTPDQNFSIYLASEQRTLLAYSLLQDGRHCTQYVNLRISGLWTRGSAHACMLLATGPGKPLGCQGNHFQYRASNGDCGCGTDACTEQTQHDFWAIYSIEPTSQKFAAAIPQQSLVYDGAHCSTLQTVALRSCGRWEDHSKLKRALAPFSEMFDDLHSNDLCKSEDFTAFGTLRCVQSVCALDNVCSGKTILSNWAIYYRHPPAVFLLDPGACLQYRVEKIQSVCANYLNLKDCSPLVGIWNSVDLSQSPRQRKNGQGLSSSIAAQTETVDVLPMTVPRVRLMMPVALDGFVRSFPTNSNELFLDRLEN
eukprot:symbB.v1.2.026896.t1/scaffold2724.1/size72221/2